MLSGEIKQDTYTHTLLHIYLKVNLCFLLPSVCHVQGRRRFPFAKRHVGTRLLHDVGTWLLCHERTQDIHLEAIALQATPSLVDTTKSSRPPHKHTEPPRPSKLHDTATSQTAISPGAAGQQVLGPKFTCFTPCTTFVLQTAASEPGACRNHAGHALVSQLTFYRSSGRSTREFPRRRFAPRENQK